MKSKITKKTTETAPVILQQTKDFKYELSIGIIVKNEGKDLLRCVRSLQKLRDAIPCQLIITDTGSTDNSVEVAKKYADVFLEFEWCDDFSAARNTGVNIAEGRWFAYIDADEFLDPDCDDLIEFFKDPDHNKYDCIDIKRLDYTDTSFSKSQDIVIHRFYNFSKVKILFRDKIHEYIQPYGTANYITETALHHTGYIGVKFAYKAERNEKILYEAIKENPYNVRNFLHLANSITCAYNKIEVLEKCLSYVNDINDVDDFQYMIVIALLIKQYALNSYYNKAFILCEKYAEKIKDNSLPNLDILYYLSLSKFNCGKLDDTIKYFTRYQKMFSELKEKPDETRYGLPYFATNNEIMYQLSIYMLSDAYYLLNDYENSYQALIKIELADSKLVTSSEYIERLYKLRNYNDIIKIYKNCTNDNSLRIKVIRVLEKYVAPVLYTKHTIQFVLDLTEEITDGYIALIALRKQDFDISKLNCDIENIVKSDELVYNSDLFSDYLYHLLLHKEDIFNIIVNISSVNIVAKIKNVYAKYADYPYLVFDYITSIDVNSITNKKKILFINYLAYLYLINLGNVHSSINVTEDEILYIFDVYVKLTYSVISEIHGSDSFDKLEELPKDYACVVCLYEAGKLKDYDNLEYVKLLKQALTYNPAIHKCIDILLSLYYKENMEDDTDKKEFFALARTIKAQIKMLIADKELNSAKVLLDEYSQINPSDTEIAEMYKNFT